MRGAIVNRLCLVMLALCPACQPDVQPGDDERVDKRLPCSRYVNVDCQAALDVFGEQNERLYPKQPLTIPLGSAQLGESRHVVVRILNTAAAVSGALLRVRRIMFEADKSGDITGAPDGFSCVDAATGTACHELTGMWPPIVPWPLRDAQLPGDWSPVLKLVLHVERLDDKPRTRRLLIEAEGDPTYHGSPFVLPVSARPDL